LYYLAIQPFKAASVF